MKTGYYVRYQRDGKWGNYDIVDLTPAELKRFLDTQHPDKIMSWAQALHAWIVDHVDFESGHGEEASVQNIE